MDPDCSRRTLLKAPALALLRPARGESAGSGSAEKFTPLDLTPHFNLSPRGFGARTRARRFSEDGFIRTPSGRQEFQGIPFVLGGDSMDAKKWLVLGARGAREVELPAGGAQASFLCMAAFCDWDENETPAPDTDVVERVGQVLAEATFVYDDGEPLTAPLRRRFEVNAPSTVWGHLSFTALPHLKHAPAKLDDPLDSAVWWGELQTSVWDNAYPRNAPPLLWISALENTNPQRRLKAIRFRAAGEDPVVICGLTLYHGRDNPLRRDKLALYRLRLPEDAGDPNRWKVAVDMGIVARSYKLPTFKHDEWLQSPLASRGERAAGGPHPSELYIELTASREATLSVTDASGRRYDFDLARTDPSDPKIEVLERTKAWLHGKVTDSGTGRPTPVRIAFRSADGRYIPPYGHRTEVNRYWFQDYGADLQIGDSSFAYIDGTFQIELPAGDVYVEVSKGFEFEPVRKRVTIAPGQRALDLEISRIAGLRASGWMTADTHVHFLSPSTALLEAQAEGLNLINLLAAQWRDLFTNVGDLYQGQLTSRDGQAIVSVGTENRQHILGHLALLGGHGAPVFPMSASGPGESYLGDPLTYSLAEWADRARAREGLAVAVHFPYPTGELAADIVLGKIDAVEVYPHGFNTLGVLDWYRYLNCGYRLPVVGGTDKMGAYMPAGANRTYAFIEDGELTFANWAKAVRGGRTFMTSGPLLTFEADGKTPGDDIRLAGADASIEVRARATSPVPLHTLQVVWNGRVVASREENGGARELVLRDAVHVTGPGWLAARCSSKLGPQSAWPFGIHAHTSPIYVAAPGRELFSRTAAAYMLTLIEGSEAWARNLATRPADPEQFARVLKVFQDARAQLHERLHRDGAIGNQPSAVGK